MKRERRQVIAYIMGRLVSGKEASTVFDTFNQQYISLSGTVSPRAISVFDINRRTNFSGWGRASRYSLFDQTHRHFISFLIAGDYFQGFDSNSQIRCL